MADAPMMRLLKRSTWTCWSCCDGCVGDDVSSTASEYGDLSMQTVAHIESFDESFSRPSSVSPHIDTTVDMWISTIDEYRVLEQLLVAKNNSDQFTTTVNNSSFRGNSSSTALLISTIEHIRRNPEKYIAHLESQNNSSNKSIASDFLELAHKRILLHRIVSSIGITPEYSIGDDTKNETLALPPDPLIFSNFSLTETKKTRRYSKTMAAPSYIDEKQAQPGSKRGVMGDIERISISNRSSSSSAIAEDRATSQVSKRVSKLWAERIELSTTISPMHGTQGGRVGGNTFAELYSKYSKAPNAKTGDNNTNSSSSVWEPPVRPKWPLPDITFQVITGLRQRRSLKLTEYHILDIKQGTKICHVYLYTELRKILLRSSQSIVIVLKSSTELHYRSPIASHIVQQITSRVRLRLTLEKSNFSANVVSTLGLGSSIVSASDDNDLNFQGVTYSTETTLKLVEEIASQNVLETEKTMRDYAIELGSQAAELVSANAITTGGNGKSGDSDTVEEDRSLTPKKESQKKRSMHDGLMVTRSIRGFDSQNHKSGSSEERVLMRIREILLDKCTPEGHTLKSYCDEFKQSHSSSIAAGGGGGEANQDRPQTLLRIRKIRKFIDAMSEHLILSRGGELGSLLIVPQEYSNNKSSQSSSVFGILDLSQGELAELTLLIYACAEESIFLPLKSMIVEDLTESHNIAVSDSINRITDEYINSRLNSGDSEDSSLNNGSMQNGMTNENSISELTDKELTKKIRILSNKTQSDWGVPDDFISPLGWKSAVYELSLLEHNLTPSVMMSALVKACKAIYTEYKCAVVPLYQKKARSKEVKPLSADDFVPIFIFVFCNGDLRHPQLDRDIMWQLCHADQLRGEFGYFLTVFESAIEYICNERVVLPAPRNVVQMATATYPNSNPTLEKKKSLFSRRISTFIVNKAPEALATESVSSVFQTLHLQPDITRETFSSDANL